MLHLFGHSVQWVAPSYRPEIRGRRENDLEVFIDAVERYERNAARFGLQLLHECGITDLDPWFFDFAETDWRYVETFYRTGRFRPGRAASSAARPRSSPCRSRRWQPRRVEERFAF